LLFNPARQFGQANDTKRRSDLTAILNAIGQYGASNSGQLPSEVGALPANTATTLNSTNFPLLCAQLVPNYLQQSLLIHLVITKLVSMQQHVRVHGQPVHLLSTK